MVRTKESAAFRVAAGAKAPSKFKAPSAPSSPSVEKLGKDNLPVNRYCPRETPAWQKKITLFCDKNSVNGCNSATSNDESVKTNNNLNTMNNNNSPFNRMKKKRSEMPSENMSPMKMKKVSSINEVDGCESMDID